MKRRDAPRLALKRVYDQASTDDGYRILVDRLWPRGVTRERAALDEWAKEIAPSPELRADWQHDPNRFEQFAQRYREELDANPAVRTVRDTIGAHDTVTLVYGARDTRHNHAIVLRDYLTARR